MISTDQILRSVLDGRVFLIGEFRNAKVSTSNSVDCNSGEAIKEHEIVYAVEAGSTFGQVMIYRRPPTGFSEGDNPTTGLVKGARYAFDLDRLVRKSGFVNAHLGHREPELIVP